ncbi:MAG: hypothetical protein HYX69_11335 [Planctomycetia bacterium]|nr:hypothetical protein [Planctomycetia bacterium]
MSKVETSGLEPPTPGLQSFGAPTETPEKQAVCDGSGFGRTTGRTRNGLERIIEAWETLPEAIKRAMLALIG